VSAIELPISLTLREPMKMLKFIALSAMALSLAACGETWGQRAVTGGGIGAGTGALVGAVTPIGLLPGALVGGAVGAGVGAATTPPRR
jgi:osmotically inducible lipoprotein OsmB